VQIECRGRPNRVQQSARLIDRIGIERPLKVWVIQRIKELSSELRVHSLGNPCVLVEREVEILVSRTRENIPPRIAKKVGACWERCGGIAIRVVESLRGGSRH